MKIHSVPDIITDSVTDFCIAKFQSVEKSFDVTSPSPCDVDLTGQGPQVGIYP